MYIKYGVNINIRKLLMDIGRFIPANFVIERIIPLNEINK